jgi:hypothetical protein
VAGSPIATRLGNPQDDMLDILHTNFAGEHRSDRSLSAEYPVSVRLRYMLHCNVVKKLVKKLVVKKVVHLRTLNLISDGSGFNATRSRSHSSNQASNNDSASKYSRDVVMLLGVLIG